jgi:hypothetical protein
MKKIIVLFAGLFLMSFAAQNLNAQFTATDDAETHAYIVAPISILKTADLNFGSIVPNTTAGTVVIAPAGTRSFTGGPTGYVGATAITPTAASFTVTGEKGASFSIVVTNPFFDLTHSTTSDVMTVNNIVTLPSGTSTLDGTTGTRVINVGATLEVDAAQEPGTYTNTDALEITVTYN